MAAGGVRPAKRVRAASPAGEPVGVRTRSSKKPALAPSGEESNEQPPADEQEQAHPNVRNGLVKDVVLMRMPPLMITRHKMKAVLLMTTSHKIKAILFTQSSVI